MAHFRISGWAKVRNEPREVRLGGSGGIQTVPEELVPGMPPGLTWAWG